MMPALLLLLLLPCLAFAQPDTTWSQTVGLNNRSYFYDVIVVNDSVIVACGNSQTVSGAEVNRDFLIAGFSLSGELLYAHTLLESNNTELLEGLCWLGGDTVIAVGATDVQNDILNILAFSAATGDTFWTRAYTGAGLSRARGVIKLADGGFAITGFKLGPQNRSDLWFVVCESDGDTVFTRSSGNTATDIGNALVQLPNGNIRIAALWREIPTSDYDQWVRTYDLDGNIVGTDVFFGTGGDDFVYNVSLDPEGNFWLIGRTASSGGAGYVSVIPATGQNYSLTFASNGFADQFFDGIPWFGGMMFAGRSGNQASYSSPFMRSIDEDNQSIWTWRYGAAGTDVGFNAMAVLPNGGAVAVGSLALAEDTSVVSAYVLTIAPPAGVQGTVTGMSDGEPVIGARVKAAGDSRYTLTDVNGEYRLELAAGTYDIVVTGDCIESDTVFGVTTVENQLAEASFEVGQPAYDFLQSSINIIAENETVGGTTLLLGNSGTGVMSYSIEAVALAPVGSWISVQPSIGTIAPDEQIQVNVIVEADTTNDGIYEFFGEVTVHTNACPDTAVTLPVLVTVLETGDPAALPGNFALSTPYPNPFNSSATLTLSIPLETELRLDVFNIEGRWLKTVQDGRIPAGSYNINIDLTGQASGLYLLRAHSPSFSATRKLLYVR